MDEKKWNLAGAFAFVLLTLQSSRPGTAFAAEPSAYGDNQSQADRGERINVKELKEKYWAKGEENELRVVRNRLYSKAGKVEVGVFVGTISTDPFLSVRNLGGSIGYHFTEYIGFDVVAWKSFSEHSSAYDEFLQQVSSGVLPDTNPPTAFYAGEVAFSPIYGKLSLVGKAIIYLDLHVLGGVGITQTQNGDYFTPEIGIGQQIYLSKFFSLRLDYRLTHYNETIINVVTGAPIGPNSNYSSVITLGVTALF